jgi:anti-anti-sigma factor
MLAAELSQRSASRVERPQMACPDAAAPTVEIEVSRMRGNMIVRVKGEATFETAAGLLDCLCAASALHPAIVTLDLSELRFISTLAMGVLVTYRRGVLRWGGRVLLTQQLQPAVQEALARAELLDLFETAASPQKALEQRERSLEPVGC